MAPGPTKVSRVARHKVTIGKAHRIIRNHLKASGITENMINHDKMEIDIRKKIEESEKGSQDTEMQDCVIDAFIQKVLSDSKWAASTKGDEEQVPADKSLVREKTLASKRTAKVAGSLERRIAVPAPRRPATNGSLQGPRNTNENAAGVTNPSTSTKIP
ncbi:hypothetical protein K3495_g2242 [Podosphaera aphanis]|nr:hypothetical protein K3495_g2242 [Podosphaera aphanis]